VKGVPIIRPRRTIDVEWGLAHLEAVFREVKRRPIDRA
jgi:hypothetical protein